MLPLESLLRYWPRERFPPLPLRVYEGRVVAARVHRAEVSLRKRAGAQQQLELVAQVRPHHLGPVRGNREGDAAVGERPDRVAESVFVGERAREQVRGGQISRTVPASTSARMISSS